MDSAKSQLIDRLKTANSVLVTVSRNPTVDQLAACIGLTLLINKLEKHGSAVFSGKIPSTIEFLKPEETIEKTADSLRDFIIALDKNKADKLRYKVEDQTVRIFITPYRTSLSEKDLDFSQGDFNVELVIALGVKQQEDLDQAIVSHGRILHDATVACITTSDQSNLGSISWRDPTASSLCELVTDLAEGMGEKLIDEQIATALLTGVIAETNRFSNEKTTSQTMSVSAKLMAAGANQQLVATNLDAPPAPINLKHEASPDDDADNVASDDDGTLSIRHDEEELNLTTLPKPAEDSQANEDIPPAPDEQPPSGPRLVTEPPSLGGMLTANTVPEQYDPSTDPLSGSMRQLSAVPPPVLGKARPFGTELNGPEPTSPGPDQPPSGEPPAPAFTPPPATWTPPPAPDVPPQAPMPPPIAPLPPPVPLTSPITSPAPPIDSVPTASVAEDEQTLNDLEKAVDSPHLQGADISDAREQVQAVLAQSTDAQPQARDDLNAAPLGGRLHVDEDKPAPEAEQARNTTGLDPSLFSELPSKDGEAPPVPPPINFGPDNENK